MRACLWTVLALCLAVAPARPDEQLIDGRDAVNKKISDIRFVRYGDKPVGTRDLRAAMATQEGARFKRRFFRDDLATLVNLYRSHGYRTAQITRKRFFLTPDDQLRIQIEIDSGQKWIVDHVQIRGADGFDADSLLLQLKITPGAALNYGEVVRGERTLQSYFNDRGYPRATAKSVLIDKPSIHSADVVYDVAPGPRLYIGTITIVDAEQLHTRESVIRRQLTIKEGDLFNPNRLSRSRRRLARTGLFRSVSIDLPAPAPGDSLQDLQIHLREKKHILLGANLFISNTDPRVTANLQDNNLWGTGTRLGFDASLGKPVQGFTAFYSQRNFLDTDADLVFSAGVSEEWTDTRVFGDPTDRRQFDDLTANDSILRDLLFFGGETTANQYISSITYDYTQVERLWEVSATLTRTWFDAFLTNFTLSWTRANNRPTEGASISYLPDDLLAAGGEDTDGDNGDGGFFDDGDDFFGDGDSSGGDGDDFFGDGDSSGDGGDDFFGDSSGKPAQDAAADYSLDGRIPANDLWRDILTNRSRALNFKTEAQFDTRDNRIAPTRGLFTRLTMLYAFEFKGRLSYVLDTDFEVRRYQPLGAGFTLALAGRAVRAISLRQGRALPQTYWKSFGGDGSVRGIRRSSIVDTGGGRTGLNFRSELRYAYEKLGLVLFWDTAGVWRKFNEISTAGFKDGYGAGLRYTIGLPFRLDFGFADSFKDKRFYLSIGQAF